MAFLFYVFTSASLRCRRRATADERFASAATEDASAICLSKAAPFTTLYDDDDDAKSTDASGPEYDDVKSTDTSGPEHVNDSSSEDSDTEGTDVMPNSDLSSVEADSDSECSSAKKLQQIPAQRGKMNQRRKVRRSKHQKESTPIGAVVNALDAWMTSKNDAHAYEHQSMPISANAEHQSQKLDGLQDAMAKLAPHEVALMKALLDVKLSSL